LQKHLTNAFAFRKYRHSLYKDSGLKENLLELNEGIAEFTGIIVSGRNKEQTMSSLVNGIDEFLITQHLFVHLLTIPLLFMDIYCMIKIKTGIRELYQKQILLIILSKTSMLICRLI
jgi:hypothetical protein